MRTMQDFKPVKEGKVREVYDNGESLIIVATDRISAFDVILKNKITEKGAILTKMSKFWFGFTKDIVKNHMLSTDTADMPEFFQKEEFDGNSMKCKKLSARKGLTATVCFAVSCTFFLWNALCGAILRAAAGKATRKTAQSAASGSQRG